MSEQIFKVNFNLVRLQMLNFIKADIKTTMYHILCDRLLSVDGKCSEW